ncbi:acyl-CoA reductase [Alteromonas sp. a30]|uniref:acyl-CoA reductase n=1 Tax=Alteromonas sp. a30 TaxID=2730917 RepID=UPI0022823BA6|nr:acyl-CoA reductase [Alteromonas sp. a30]MCY7294520.1 hypothetical protein [Alteromonas sp. a30]
MTQPNKIDAPDFQVQILVPTSLSNEGEPASCDSRGLGCVLERMQLLPLEPFNAPTLTFLHEFSKALLLEKEPELKALGFWLRKSQVVKWQKEYESSLEKDAENHIFRFPLGRILHFTPANVDTMFVYSWVCALVLGNINVLRLSRQTSFVKQRLLSMINTLFQKPQFNALSERNIFITYEHQAHITSALSSLSDARILWGGDEAVNQIRSVPAKPKTRDIGFSDRYSVAVINGEKLTSNHELAEVAEKLWRDIQPYQQQACSSPKVLFWLGDDSQKNALAQALNQLAEMYQAPELTRKNEHLVTTQLIQSQSKEINILLSEHLCILELPTFSPEKLNWHAGNGLLYVVDVASLDDAIESVDERCQTLIYWGIDRQLWVKLMQQSPIISLDRIVPLGQALDFNVIWDGFDLMEQLQRKITIL